MKTASATDVKNRFGEYLHDTVKEPVIIEKTGRPVAVMISMEEFQRFQAMEDAFWIQKAEEAEAGGYLGAKGTKAFIKAMLKEKS